MVLPNHLTQLFKFFKCKRDAITGNFTIKHMGYLIRSFRFPIPFRMFEKCKQHCQIELFL